MKYYDLERGVLYDLSCFVSSVLNHRALLNGPRFYRLSKKKHIRNVIETACSDPLHPLSEASKASLAPGQNMAAIVSFLKDCQQQEEIARRLRRDEWVSISSEFDALTHKAFVRMMDGELFGNNMISEFKGSEYIVEQEDSYLLSLVFEDASFSEGYDPDCAISCLELSHKDGGYCIEFIQDDLETGPRQIALCFTTAKTKVVCYNYANGQDPIYQPWRMIARSLHALEVKKELLGAGCCIAQEKALLPLCRYAPLMQSYNVPDDRDDSEGTLLFSSFAAKSGNKKIVDLARRYAECANTKQKPRLSRSMQSALNDCKNEPLFRSILAQIVSAASPYVKKPEANIDQNLLRWTRSRITSHIHASGFKGEYPHFRKTSAYRGLHILQIDNVPYLIGNEKHMASYIDCIEEDFGDLLQIAFIIGTVFLKQRQCDSFSSMDSLSAFFKEAGRRKARVLLLAVNESDADDPREFDATTMTAIKSSQCQKLSKEERHYVFTQNRPGLVSATIMWVLAGMLFGLLLCCAAVLIAVACTLIMGFSFSDAIALICEIPWLAFLLFASLAFAACMIVFDLIARRRG